MMSIINFSNTINSELNRSDRNCKRQFDSNRIDDNKKKKNRIYLNKYV